MKSVAAKVSGSGARASSPAVFGVSPNTFSIEVWRHCFLNRSKDKSGGVAGAAPAFVKQN
jgi:hypothetical protein